jgi:hypothetical protein
MSTLKSSGGGSKDAGSKSGKLQAPESKSEIEDVLKQLLDYEILVDHTIISELSPSGNPNIDCDRFAVYKTNKSTFIAACKKSLLEKNGDMKRSAKNMCMAVRFLTLSRENRMILLNAKENEESCPGFLSLNTFKNYWGLIKTERFARDVRFIYELK